MNEVEVTMLALADRPTIKYQLEELIKREGITEFPGSLDELGEKLGDKDVVDLLVKDQRRFGIQTNLESKELSKQFTRDNVSEWRSILEDEAAKLTISSVEGKLKTIFDEVVSERSSRIDKETQAKANALEKDKKKWASDDERNKSVVKNAVAGDSDMEEKLDTIIDAKGEDHLSTIYWIGKREAGKYTDGTDTYKYIKLGIRDAIKSEYSKVVEKNESVNYLNNANRFL